MGFATEESEFNSRKGQTGSGVHPTSCVTGIVGFSPGLKRLGRQAIPPHPIRLFTQAEEELALFIFTSYPRDE
jgi:hypothetical protein